MRCRRKRRRCALSPFRSSPSTPRHLTHLSAALSVRETPLHPVTARPAHPSPLLALDAQVGPTCVEGYESIGKAPRRATVRKAAEHKVRARVCARGGRGVGRGGARERQGWPSAREGGGVDGGSRPTCLSPLAALRCVAGGVGRAVARACGALPAQDGQHDARCGGVRGGGVVRAGERPPPSPRVRRPPAAPPRHRVLVSPLGGGGRTRTSRVSIAPSTLARLGALRPDERRRAVGAVRRCVGEAGAAQSVVLVFGSKPNQSY